MRNYETTVDYIKNWIRGYAIDNNINTLVVGVSGGIDSALVSTLCLMTGLKTILVEMPIKTNDNYKDDETAGTRHIMWLQEKFDNIEHVRVDLTDAFNVFKSTLKPHLDSKNFDLTMANTASRLRMTTLYSFSNSYRGIVVGTGNKVEDFGIGFFTVGGDGQVDISPIADLMKSEVYELADYLGVNKEIINSRPTDGLWDDGRTDEDQIGASYDELEWAMKYAETHDEILEVDLDERQVVVMDIYLKRHNANKFKMLPIPICKIS